MPLKPGTRLGVYEIIAPLGEGGMGVVYRAYDTQLEREVALKFLPEGFADDGDRHARFEREAKVLASLNHSNIAVLYGLEHLDGQHALVMELVEGDDLSALIARGPLPLTEALPIAKQIAGALEAAHERGVVHRDLKPGNIKVRADGTVKVLDFGLAKALEPTRTPASSSGDSPTITSWDTKLGAVIGSGPYMAPEQVRGKTVDRRADIWAFGVVLYEMLTGVPLFSGEAMADVLAAVLRQDVDLTALPPEISPRIVQLLARCLDRDIRRRLRDIGEARVAIEEELTGSEAQRFLHAQSIPISVSSLPGSTVGWRPQAGAHGGWWLLLGVVAVGFVLGVAGLALYRQGENVQRRATEGIKFDQVSFSPQAIFQAAFAPDGNTIVYSAALEGNVPELFVIRPEFPEPRPLGLPRTHLLAISSKGEMAVLTNVRYVWQRLFTGTLARVSLGGTAPREILKNVRQADWSPDGSELAVIREADGKDQLEYPIGTVLYRTAGYLSDLRVSPDGNHVALFEHPVKFDDRGSVMVVDRAGKGTMLSGDYGGEEGLAWSPSGDEVLFTASPAGGGHILYAVDLFGHRRVALRSAGGLTMQDVSRSGRWLVTRDDLRDEIFVLAPGSRSERDLSWLDFPNSPYLSADGRTLLFTDASTAAGPNYAVCLRTTEGGPIVRLGEGQGYGLSQDGKRVLAILYTPPGLVIYPTGPGEAQHLPRGKLEAYQSACWFPDGRKVLVTGNEPGKATRCYIQDVSGGLPRPVTPEGTTNGMVSPDGARILYADADGTYFIQPLKGGSSQPVPGLTPEDQVIRWSADGRALYLFRGAAIPFLFERLEIASGRREVIREVAPADRKGVLSAQGAAITGDHGTYAYRFFRMTSHLFVVDGAQ
jgi:Tol biopolymer transport system component